MNKSTLIAIAAFGALALAYLATRETQVSVGIRHLTVAPVAAESFTGIEISGAAAASLSLTDGHWTVADPTKPGTTYAADEGQISTAKKALAEFSAPDFVTDKVERHAELEVTAEKGLTVKARTSTGEARALILGKAAKFGGSYVRLIGSNDVFTTTSPLSFLLKKNVTGWRKKSIATVTLEQLNAITVTPPDGAPWSLALQETEWKVTSPMPANYRFDQSAAQRFASQLTNLNAQDFSEGQPDEALGLSPGAATIVKLDRKDGTASRTLTVGTKRPDGTWPLRVDGDPQVYLLPSFQLEVVPQKLDGLRDLTVMKLDVSKVTRVTFTAGSKKAVVAKDGASWKLIDPKTPPPGVDFDPQQVPAVLSRIANLRANRVAAGVTDAAAGIGQPTVQISLALEGGTTQTLRFGAEAADASGAKFVYARGSADSLLYGMNAGDKTAFESPVELFKKPAPPPDFSNARGLDQLPPEIRRQLEAQLRQRQN